MSVLAAVAQRSGGTVDVLGHSLGGLVALRAAALSPYLRRLVLI